MNTVAHGFEFSRVLKNILYDIIGISFIYLTPTIVHGLNFPLYYAEPMRIVLLISLFHFHKLNSWILALTLPFFSWLVSGHPVIYKAFIMSIELGINVFFFYRFLPLFRSAFPAVLLSVAISKAIYYLLKYLFISLMLLEGSLVSTPWIYQVLTAFVFAIYAHFAITSSSSIANKIS